MLLIPAIDIKDNFCVRLKKGIMDDSIIFSKNPILIINEWINLGAKRLHIVDLNGAVEGKPKNLFMIKSIINFVNGRIPIQIGGGIRSRAIIEYYFEIGISYIILGTKAITNVNFLSNISYKFPNKIILGLDVKNNKLAINGWNNFLKISFINFIKKIKNIPIESIICTDINKDGMLSGINFDLISILMKITKKSVIVSGGLSSLEDIKILFNLQNNGVLGLICGKSIYTGRLNFFCIQEKIKNINNIYINKY